MTDVIWFLTGVLAGTAVSYVSFWCMARRLIKRIEKEVDEA